MIVNEERLTMALRYLAETDEPISAAKARMVGLDKQEKTVIGVQILDLRGQGGTVGEKDAQARDSEEYRQWLEDYQDAVLDYETMKNKRHTEELIVEVWRTDNANRRKGNI